jgi:prepilin-type N-terminal cleavage/methylation domain-containing protein
MRMTVSIDRNRYRFRTPSGFTLIEVLLALVIFAIGILALGALQVRYIGGNALARNQTEAISIATDVLERLISVPADGSTDLVDGRHGPIMVGGHQVTWDVTPGPAGGVLSVVVRVYPNVRGARTISFSYYISERDS